MAIIIGNNRDNNRVGTDRNDLMLGLGGDDTLSGGKGNDAILGGRGSDSISGGSGRDWLDGGKGDDVIDGGTGNDTIRGDSGDDLIYGGGGDDVIFGDSVGGRDRDDDDDCHDDRSNLQAWGWQGNDRHDDDDDRDQGGSRNDSIYGGDGRDWIDGGRGNDKIAGGAGNDTIFGGSGNDTLIGGSGADLLTGGSGQDRYVYLSASDSPAASGWDRILDFKQGQDKIDFAAFRNATTDLDLVWRGEDPAEPGAWGVWSKNAWNSTFVFADTSGDGKADLKIELKNTPGLNLAVTDFIGVSADAQANQAPAITSNGGGDSAAVGVAENTTAVTDVDATDADLPAQTLTYSIVGGADASLFTIDSGSGVLSFNNAPNFENPQDAGTNNVYDVTVRASDGTLFDEQAIAVTVTNANDAPVANDDTVLTNFAPGSGIDIPSSALLFNDTDLENDPLSINSVGNPAINDLVALSLGNVTYIDNAPEDGSFQYTAFDGTNSSGPATVIVDTQTGNTVTGTGANEILIGSNSGDVLNAGSGADFAFGNAGNDTIKGGAGNDTLAGGADVDTLNYDDSPARVIVNLLNNQIVVGGDTVLGGTARDGFGTTDTASGFETVIGSPFNDFLQGATNVANRLEGGAGNDTLVGSGMSDSNSIPGAANDTLLGGTGDDALRQTRGHDSIVGGDGSDRLEFTNPNGTSTTGIGYGGAIGVSVNLQTGISDADPSGSDTINGALGNVGTVSGIELVVGTAGNDLFVGGDPAHGPDFFGSSVTESFRPVGGNDTITGPMGDGFSVRADYSTNLNTQPVSVNLGTGEASDGMGGTDTLVRVDHVFGGAGNDTLLGGGQERASSGAFFEIFRGNAGNDTIDGAGTDTMVGAAGNNRVNYGNSPAAVTVNLSAAPFVVGIDTVQGGTARDGFGFTDTLLNINQVEGSIHDDTLVGGASDHRLIGGAGNDLLVGTARGVEASYQNSGSAVDANLAMGTASDGFGSFDTLLNIDDLRGSDFNDVLTGNSANNRLTGEGGADTIDGGGGIDLASFVGTPLAKGGVNAFIENGSGAVVDGFGSIDILSNIEGLIGTHSADTLAGGLGDQWLIGRGGSDSIGGGEGNDWVSYIDDPAGVTASLATGTATDGWGGVWALAGNDTLSGIENIEGSSFNDTLTGDDNANRIVGLGGNDTLEGGAGDDIVDGGAGDDLIIGGDGAGDDTYQGGDGSDTVSYASTSQGVTANLASGTASGVEIGTDTLISVANLIGGTGNDSLTGDAIGNLLDGAAGDDFIQGGGGNDTLQGGAGNDTIDGGANDTGIGDRLSFSNAATGINFTLVQSSSDTMVDLGAFGLGTDTYRNIEGVVGSSFNDTLTGSSAGDRLEGGAGDDTVDGGAGSNDRIAFSGASAAINFTLVQSALDTMVNLGAVGLGTDTYRNIEGVIGSNFNDTLTGSSGNDFVSGGGGNDSIHGAEGDDTLRGSGGNDTIDGGDGIDLLEFANAGAGINFTLNQGTNPGDLVDGLWSTGPLPGGIGTDSYKNMEGVIGTNFNDTLTGSTGSDVLDGGAGNDTLNGGGTFDTANDTLLGGAGNDSLRQTRGNDSIDGGDGSDSLAFFTGFVYFGPVGVNVNLAAGTSDADASTPGDVATISSIEFVTGNFGDDVFVGGDPLHAPGIETGPTEFFQPLGGTDTITGKAGRGWSAAVDYSTNSSLQPVTVVLGNSNNVGMAFDGFGFIDSLTEVDVVRGGAGNDSLVGGSYQQGASGVFVEAFRGNAGNDTIDGGGSDTVIGAHGVTDRVEYNNSPFAVVVNTGLTPVIGTPYGTVNPGTARDGFDFMGGGTDTLIDINVVRGSNSSDTLVGGNPKFDNNERFEGLAGNDSIDGGSGNDETDYSSSTAAVLVNLGAGTAFDGFGGVDMLQSIERARGSDFNDTLIGGANALERFTGGRGNDSIDGGSMTGVNYAAFVLGTSGANAFVASGVGIATNDGQGGADSLVNINGLWGSNFNDTLTGGAGDQWFVGQGGNDLIDGGADTDTVSYRADPAGATVNLALGTATDGWGGIWDLEGNDTLTSIENVEGSSFNDTLTGNAVANAIDGMAGNDTIEGGAGNDTLAGGADVDTLSYSDSPARVVVNLFATTTIFIDGVAVAPGTASDGYGSTDTVSGFETVVGSAFNDYIQTPSNVPNLLQGGDGNDTLSGSGVSDSIAGAMNDTLLGGMGNDLLRQTRGNDSIDGGEGFDRLEFVNNGIPYGGGIGVSVNLGAGTSDADPNNGDPVNNPFVNGRNDIATVSGIEHVLGTIGNDSLAGDANANLLEGGGGDDTLQGGGGNDTIDGGASGAAGGDRLSFSNAATGINFTLVQSSSDTMVDLGAFGLGTDTYRNIEGVVGSSFNDTLTGSSAGDRLEGGAGDDTVDGGAGGTDRIAFSGASGAINFTLVQSALDTMVNLGAVGLGTDTYRNIEGVIGSNFNDTLTGSSGDDFISGAGGNDSINGAEGDDTLRGSGGNDTIDGGDGIDLLEFANAGAGINFTLNQGVNPGDPVNGLWTTGPLPGGIGTDSYKNMEGVIGTNFNDTLTGSAGDDSLFGGAGDDTLRGGAGNDTIDGSAGSNDGIVFSDATAAIDFALVQSSFNAVVDLSAVGLGTDTYRNIEGVVGTSFNDTLMGSSADDRLQGGPGDDTIDGGEGNDRIAFTDASGPINFTLVQSGSDTAVNLSGIGLGTDTYRNIEGVVGTGFNDTLTGSSSSDFIAGANGNDSIDGAGGDDILRGSGGNDTIDGGDGIDRLDLSNATAGINITLNQGANPGDPVNGLWTTGALPGIGTEFYKNMEGVVATDFNDTLTGSSLADVLQGGRGTDVMTGNAGTDTFRFDEVPDSSADFSYADIITDFAHGDDRIDLSAIDANSSLDGDQDFVFGGNDSSTVANSVTWSETGGNTILHIDNNGDDTADMQIVLQRTGLGLTDSDFIL
jgi:Ca2+-binding RTX toxin-like protein